MKECATPIFISALVYTCRIQYLCPLYTLRVVFSCPRGRKYSGMSYIFNYGILSYTESSAKLVWYTVSHFSMLYVLILVLDPKYYQYSHFHYNDWLHLFPPDLEEMLDTAMVRDYKNLYIFDMHCLIDACNSTNARYEYCILALSHTYKYSHSGIYCRKTLLSQGMELYFWVDAHLYF